MPEVHPGQAAPSFEAFDQDENLVRLSDFKGNRQFMFFYTYMGIIRSSLLVDANGRIESVWYKISPKNTIPELLKHLGI